MEGRYKLPQRHENHIRESKSIKVLQSIIPGEWIIRDITERDYGVDLYIELVNERKELTGEIAFVQMKSTDSIQWRVTDDCFRFTKVEKSTTNYLNAIKIPTYIFLTDLTENTIYYLSVKEYIKKNYKEYLRGDTFAYEFSHVRDRFCLSSFLNSFKKANIYDQFRNELHYFISNLTRYVEFQSCHCCLDCFLQIEPDEMMFFEAMYNNITFLQYYFQCSFCLPQMHELVKEGEIYGDAYNDTLLEGVLSNHYEQLRDATIELVEKIKQVVTKEEWYYWAVNKRYIFNYFNNLKTDSLYR